MVNIIKYIIFLLLMLGGHVYGQNLTLNQLQDLMVLESSASNTLVKSPNTTSNIYIEQVGSNNAINTVITAKESTIIHQQIGDDNLIDLDVVVKELDEKIVQFGNRNFVIERVYNPSILNQFHVVQNGDNLVLEKYGANSLSEKMKVNMTGNGTAIIIRNFK